MHTYIPIRVSRLEIMALKTLGIPEDLATVLLNLELSTLGTPVWRVQKRQNSYSVSIFWRNAEQFRNIPFNARAHRQTSRRKLRSQVRMEAYIEKVKAMNIHKTQGVPDSLDRVRVIGNPSGSEGAKEPRCETPPAVSCRHSLELEQLSSTPHPSPDRPTPLSEQAAEHIDPIPEADPPSIDLAACNSVVYEERNGVPGVKFAVETREEWTPVTKAKEVKRPLPGKGNGTKRNPLRSKDEVLRLAMSCKGGHICTTEWYSRPDV